MKEKEKPREADPASQGVREERVRCFMKKASEQGIISTMKQPVRTLSVWRFLGDLFFLPRR